MCGRPQNPHVRWYHNHPASRDCLRYPSDEDGVAELKTAIVTSWADAGCRGYISTQRNILISFAYIRLQAMGRIGVYHDISQVSGWPSP